MMKFSKNRPKRQGLYLVKYPESKYENKYQILYLMLVEREWFVSDYPYLRVTDPVEEVDGCLWGEKIE